MADVPDELRARLQKVSLDAYRALRVRDYGRVDLRLTDTGEIYVIEVNANCYLEQESEFATAAAAAGLDYPDPDQPHRRPRRGTPQDRGLRLPRLRTDPRRRGADARSGSFSTGSRAAKRSDCRRMKRIRTGGIA